MSSNRNRARQAPRPTARPAAAQRPALQAAQQPSGAWEVPADDDGIFDLDAVAREARDERLRFKAGPERRIWELRTPEELDWQENSRIPEQNPTGEDLRPLLRLLLGEQYEDFVDLEISLGQVGALIKQWQEWHGIQIPESGASPRS